MLIEGVCGIDADLKLPRFECIDQRLRQLYSSFLVIGSALDRSQGLEDIDALGFSNDLQATEGAEQKFIGHIGGCLGADHHVSAEDLVSALQARSEVHRVAEDGEVAG